MTPLTAEWVAKAEADFVSAQREHRARKQPNHDLACFLAQQTAEKYLKARLQEGAIAFPRTHDLLVLLALALPVEPSWAAIRPVCQTLSAYSVAVRYPGASAGKVQAREAIRAAKAVRQAVRLALGLP
jgi:HEPN domain-containing protein